MVWDLLKVSSDLTLNKDNKYYFIKNIVFQCTVVICEI